MTNNMRIYFPADLFLATGYNPCSVLRTVEIHLPAICCAISYTTRAKTHTTRTTSRLSPVKKITVWGEGEIRWFRKMHPRRVDGERAKRVQPTGLHK